MYPLVPIVIVLAPHPSHVKLWVISMRTLFSSTYTALWGFTLGKDSSLLKRMPIGRVDTLCDPYLSSRSNTFIFKSSEMYPTNLLIFLFCERPIQWNEHVKLCLSSLGVLCTSIMHSLATQIWSLIESTWHCIDGYDFCIHIGLRKCWRLIQSLLVLL